MRFTHSIFLVVLVFSAGMLSACGSNPSNIQPTRVPTQTPFIVFVPVTTTPEPATVTPLPTITPPAATAIPPRTSTRAAVVVVRPTATRTSPPAPAGPSPTPPPACAFAAPVLIDPNDGAHRVTFATRPGSDTFTFVWTPPASVGGDDIGYKIQMDARKSTGKPAGSDTVYITHNRFVSDSQKEPCPGKQPCYIYDRDRVHNMPQGDEDVNILWYISIVKIKGSIDDRGYLTGSATECTGSRSATRQLTLEVRDAP